MEALKKPDDDPPYCPVKDTSLLKKYEIPIHYLDFNYVEKCSNGKELEKILHVLLSGEEGYYPQLIKFTQERLGGIKPTSKYLRQVTPVLNKQLLNKEELTNISDELNQWLVDVNKNNDELGKAHKSKATADLPHVRKANDVIEATKNKKDVKRIKSTDYSSWDKYDPDTEILKMDLEAEKIKNEIVGTTKKNTKTKSIKFSSFQTQAEAEFEANCEKEKGNEFFKAGEYRQALIHYTNSINFKPNCANYNNRAIANMKLNNYENAIKDCTNALKYEPYNFKANLRLAQSYEMVKNYSEAIKAAERVIQMDPNNNLAQNLINKLNISPSSKTSTRMKIVEVDIHTKTKSKNMKQKYHTKSFTKSKSDQILLAIPGPSHMSEPYYIMVENKDPDIIKTQELIINNSRQQLLYFTNPDEADEPDCLEIHVRKSDSKYKHRWCEYNDNEIKTKHKSKKQNSINLPFIKEEINENDSENDYVIVDKSQKFKKYGVDEKLETISICEVDEIEENVIECFADNGFVQNNVNVETMLIGCLRIDDENANNIKVGIKNEIEVQQQGIIEEQHGNGYIFANNQQNNSMLDNGAGGEPHPTQSSDSNINIDEVHMPFSFLKMWKSVVRDRSYTKHAEILRNLDFNRLNEVIGYKLDGTMLSDIIHTLYLHFTVPNEISRVKNLLENLPTMARFNICAMFLSASDKSRVECLFQFLEQHGQPLSLQTKKLYI